MIGFAPIATSRTELTEHLRRSTAEDERSRCPRRPSVHIAAQQAAMPHHSTAAMKPTPPHRQATALSEAVIGVLSAQAIQPVFDEPVLPAAST
jgi:hypothetical protein